MKNIKLNTVDDLFLTEESRQDANREKVIEIPLVELYPFKHHPFKVVDDERMLDTADSIREYGVLVPAIARPREEGGYELVAGHRRKRGCELAGLETMPVIVRDLDDDAAVLVMVDSNIQRESLHPTQRAFAYRMKLEAIERVKGRPKNVGQVVPDYFGKRTTEIIADGTGESYKQVQRFIRLTELIPDLLDKVDNRKIALNPAVELSYLKPHEQTMLLDAMESEQATPSLSQAQRLKQFSRDGKLTEESMLAIMSEEKKSDLDRITLNTTTLRKYFPKSYRQLTKEVLALEKQREEHRAEIGR